MTEQLLRLPILQPLTTKSREDFVQALSLQHFSRHDFLFQPGQIARYGYFVLNGAVRQYYLAEGKEIVTRLILEGDTATAFYSFFSQKPSYEYAEAVEDTELVGISRQDMEALCAKHIDIANFERKITEQYLVQEHERALSLQFQTAQERYEQLLNIHPDVFLRFSVGSIASYLGMSQETLSRLRTKKCGKNMI